LNFGIKKKKILVRQGNAWQGKVRCGFGSARHGKVGQGNVWFGTARFGLAGYGMAPLKIETIFVVRRGMARLGKAWHGKVRFFVSKKIIKNY
jgi:hypothetical protein